jgi:nicotinate phosphoribosyltransferase
VELGDSFRGRIQTSFGWGTNLTNDMGFRTLSLVVKATESNGHGTVKLSDNLNKAIGSKENIERYKKEFGYTNTKKQELVN